MIDGQLRYYLHIQNPEELPDAEWAKQHRILERIRQEEKESQKQNITELFS